MKSSSRYLNCKLHSEYSIEPNFVKNHSVKLKLYSDYFETEVSSDETHMSVWYKIQC